MSQTVSAIYRDGRLELLEPVKLAEGQKVDVVIVSERDRVRDALGDLLVDYSDTPVEEIDEEALLQVIADGFTGTTPTSEMIIQERREGP